MDNIISINKIVRNRLYGNKRKEKNYKQDEAYRFRKMGIKGIPEELNNNDILFFKKVDMIEDYMKTNNTRHIPVKTIYKGMKLGISALRSKYKQGKMPQWQIDVLNAINFVWDEHERKALVKVKKHYLVIENCLKNGIEIPKETKTFFNDIKNYSKVKGTRYYIRYLFISKYIDLDTCEILEEIDFNELEKAIYNTRLVIEPKVVIA